jgi:hypothetical protein
VSPAPLHPGDRLQVHEPGPRTTLDIDLAMVARADIPRTQLASSGFTFSGQFAAHSENRPAPGDPPVRITDDAALADVLGRAEIEIGGVRLRILGRADLHHEKLRADAQPARRRSKRLEDLADAQALLEAFPELASQLSAGRASPPGPRVRMERVAPSRSLRRSEFPPQPEVTPAEYIVAGARPQRSSGTRPVAWHVHDVLGATIDAESTVSPAP